jgi:hypothetical protein
MLIREATKDDDLQICAQMRCIAMPGPISIAMDHEPRFFDSIEIHGFANRVAVCELDGQIVGVGIMAKRRAYVDGHVTEIGYISGIRLHPTAQNSTALARGNRLFRQWSLEDQSKVPIYLCSILENNSLSRRVLLSGRAGMPSSHEIGSLYTAAIPLLKRIPLPVVEGLQIVRGGQLGAEAIIEFLNRVGRDKQFYPVYGKEDLLSANGLLRGLTLDDFFVALSGDRILGVTACWNQIPFRRMIVNQYSGYMRLVKSLLFPLTSALKLAPLPSPGDALQSLTAACIAIEGNDPEIFKHILHKIMQDKYASGKTILLVGLMEGDSLLDVVRKYFHMPARSCIYGLHWGGTDPVSKFTNRLPYAELGSL